MNDHHINHMKKAIQQADIAVKNGEVPVGSLLILQNGETFTSHNAPIQLHDASAHAEMRVIRAAAKATGNYRLAGSTLYVTLEPCLMCAGMMLHARIARLIYGATDPKTGAVCSLYQTLSDPRQNHQIEVQGGILSEACGAQLKNFFKQRRK